MVAVVDAQVPAAVGAAVAGDDAAVTGEDAALALDSHAVHPLPHPERHAGHVGPVAAVTGHRGPGS